MNSPSANLSVWVGKKMICIRIVGRANFTSSVDFKTLINSLRHRGYSHFVLDLSDCLLMDSTFLGVLAGIGLNFSNARNGRHEPFVELLNPKPKICELLDNLGITPYFKAIHSERPIRECFDPLKSGDTSRMELTRECLRAHQTLMDIQPENAPRFKDVTKFLAEDLERLEGNNGTASSKE